MTSLISSALACCCAVSPPILFELFGALGELRLLPRARCPPALKQGLLATQDLLYLRFGASVRQGPRHRHLCRSVALGLEPGLPPLELVELPCDHLQIGPRHGFMEADHEITGADLVTVPHPNFADDSPCTNGSGVQNSIIDFGRPIISVEFVVPPEHPELPELNRRSVDHLVYGSLSTYPGSRDRPT